MARTWEPGKSYGQVTDELVANACQTMLLNDKAVKEMARENMSLAEKVADVLDDVREKIKAAFDGIQEENRAVFAAVRAVTDEIDNIAELWGRGIAEATENYNAERTVIEAEGKEKTAPEGGEVQYQIVDSIVGESGTDYGPGVVLDSTLLDNLTDDERVEMVKLYIQSIEGQSFTAHDKNGNPVDVKVEESRKKFKNKSGKRVSVNRDLLTKNRDSAVKQESIVLVDELISAATEGQHTSPQYSHGWLDNYGLNPWQEWTVFVQDKSGMIWRASLQIATATNGEKILYDIFPIKKVERRGKSRTISTVSSKPQVGSEVKSQNQRFDNSEDSAGNALTRQQAEFFADSKIRDAEGRLKVMYRGGDGDFTVFDRRKSSYSNLYGRGFYFTDSREHAGQYGRARAFYLNITTPLQAGDKTFKRAQVRAFLEAVAEDDDYGLENYGYGATVESVLHSLWGKDDFSIIADVNATCIGDMVAAAELFNSVNGTNFDGIVVPTETVAFRSNQIKETDNKAPTKHEDIRYQRFDDTTDDTAEEQAGRKEAYARIQSENAILKETVDALRRLNSRQDKTMAALTNKPGLGRIEIAAQKRLDTQKYVGRYAERVDNRNVRRIRAFVNDLAPHYSLYQVKRSFRLNA